MLVQCTRRLYHCRLMPITSIVTPGALSVQIVPQKQASLLSVSLLNFTSFGFTDSLNEGGANTFDYNGPSQVVKTIATAVSAQGVILDIVPPSPNSS